MTTTWQLMGGAFAGPLFIATFLIAGAARANYNPLRHPVSSLAIGEFGWVQAANFIITGLLILVFAIGLWRTLRTPGGSTWGPLLVGTVAIGLIGAGIFTAEPLSGYPPGTADRSLPYSTHGLLHDLFSTPVFVGLPAACFVFTRFFARLRERGWAIYSAASGLGMLIAFFFASMGFSQAEGFVDFGGLFQRITLVVGLGWLTLLAIHLLSSS